MSELTPRQKYKQKHPERVRDQARAYREKNKDKLQTYRRQNKAATMVASAIRRANDKGWEVDSKETLLAHVKNQTGEACQCCGNPWGEDRESSPSLDRVNSSLGYTTCNLRVICHTCNRQKSDLSLDKINQIAEYIKRNS